MQSGKVTTILILAVALAAAGYAWWHQQKRGDAALQFWGSADAFRVRHGETVELLTLAPMLAEANSADATPTELPLVRDAQRRAWQVRQRHDLSKIRGVLHARQALIEDASFEWSRVAEASPDWQFALRFATAQGTVPGETLLLLDLDGKWAQKTDADAPIVGLGIADGLRTFFADVADDQAADTTAKK